MGPERIALFLGFISGILKIISCQCDTRCLGAGCMSGPNPKKGKNIRPHQVMSTLSCKSKCFEDQCVVGCRGPNCESYCKGFKCEAICDGDYCTSTCEGYLCSAWCQGRNCKIKENTSQQKISENDDRSPKKRWEDMVVVLPKNPKLPPHPPQVPSAPDPSVIYRPSNLDSGPNAPESSDGAQPPLSTPKNRVSADGEAAPPISPTLPANNPSRSVYQNPFVSYGYITPNWLKGPPIPIRSGLRTSSRGALRTNIPTNELETPLSLTGVKLGEPFVSPSEKILHKNTADDDGTGDDGTADEFLNFLNNLRNDGDSNLGSIRISGDLWPFLVAINKLELSLYGFMGTEDSSNFGGLPVAQRSYDGFGSLRSPTDPREPSNAEFTNSGSLRSIPGSSDAQSSAESIGYPTASDLVFRSVGTGGGLYIPSNDIKQSWRKGRIDSEARERDRGGGRFVSSVFKSDRDDRGPSKEFVTRHGTGSGGHKRIIRGEGYAPTKKKTV